MPTVLSIKIATGTLDIFPESGNIPLQRLLGFASRYSSQRKFLLVSKILGKHYPVSPKIMRWSYRALARRVISQTIEGASVWIGMAETATGLGYGVYVAAQDAGLKNTLFLQTTRYHLDQIESLPFQEAHSHATDFFLYIPVQPELKQRFMNASTLVLIDDEISTGKTFLRLIKAYQSKNPGLRQVYIVSLVLFANPTDRLELEIESGIEVIWIALRSGTLNFTETTINQPSPPVVNVSSTQACKKHLLAWPGRLGISESLKLDPDCVNQLTSHFYQSADLNVFKVHINDCLNQHFADTRGQNKILVLGTGECNAPAVLLATALEGAGFRVKVQATTRSPILLGQDIGIVEQFKDNYEDDIPNFIYNLNPNDYQEIIVCHETPLNDALLTIVKRWHAISARFQMPEPTFDNQNCSHATLHFYRP